MNTYFKIVFFKRNILLFLAAILFIFSIVVTKYITYTASPAKVQEHLTASIHQNENQFLHFVADTVLLKKIIVSPTNVSDKIQLTTFPFGIYIFQEQNLLYWNNNNYTVSKEDVLKADGNYFVQYQNGSFEFIKQTISVNHQSFIVAALIPIRFHYFIENNYLKSSFAGHPEIEKYYQISDDANALPIVSSNQKELFKISKKTLDVNLDYDLPTIILRTIAIMCILVYIHRFSMKTLQQKTFAQAFFYLFTILLVLRGISYTTNFPFNFSRLTLFDPSIYASNFFNPSLGDLFINTIFILWLILFYKFNYKKNTTTNISLFTQKTVQKTLPFIQLVLLVAATFITTSTIKSLVLDSKISLDVTNFFSLSVYSLVSFVILSLCVIGFYHLSHILLQNIFDKKIKLSLQLLTIAVAGLVVISFQIGSVAAVTNSIILVWLMLFVSIINTRKKDTAVYLFNSSFFVLWIMFFSVSVAALIIQQNNYIEKEQRKIWAEKLAEQIDPNSETLLKIATTNFSDYFLQNNFNRFNQEFSNKFIKDSLVNENFSGYLNKYETKIYTYDKSFKPLYNEDSIPFSVVKTIIENNSKATSIPHLYSFENNSKKENFIYEKTVLKDTQILGYLFVMVKPKQYKSEALYPELFKQVKDLSSDFNTHYSYAVYNNGILINNFNDYSFPSTLSKNNIPSKKFEFREQQGYNELWYTNNNGKIVVIVKKNAAILELLTLFAYLFCIFLIVVALLHSVIFFTKTKFNIQKLFTIFHFNIKTQIQATIIAVSLLSFVVIGITTISFFIYRFNENNHDRLSKNIQVIANQVEEKLKATNAHFAFDDMLDFTTLGFGNSLEKTINDIAEIFNTDINLYNTSGTLIASTQPYIFNKQLLSEKLQPTAYIALNDNKKSRYIQSEKIASFKYLSIYAPVNDEAGNTYAYINIPYLNSQQELNQEISGLLSTLMNLNAFIFLLAGAVAYTATGRITASYNLISEKMKAINIGFKNEEIVWNKNDEIGGLINEYNTMVRKLDASVKALTKSEREGAWREMARQVAHEIKNPLTPMKLSVQYLQKSINSEKINFKELTNNVTNTLIEQIEQLSKIASDFSQFANIENQQPELFNVSDVIASLIELYKTRDNIIIEWIKNDEPYSIYADKAQISRLFKNLITNAIEASNENEVIRIIISQSKTNNAIEVKVTDNGSGIDEAMKQNIFTPNFTTKSSGTGLGLAICKGIVERANGTISFTTEKNVGTTFKVRFII